MTKAFTAGNGVTVAVEPDNDLFLRWVDGVDGTLAFRGDVTIALREFFLHERDKELGRWRDPESPDLVVYARDGEEKVRVVDERCGWAWEISPSTKAYETSVLYDVVKAGHAYFAADPEPKPWHDAKPGEVWALTYEGVEQAWGVAFDGSSSRLVFACGDSRLSEKDAEITAGRRIWPEVVSDVA
ncbi:hypothetical protein EDF60_1651 [Leucobacter luti]|uniref:hypothetical protein n=1 Tax=Leucobacter luti TaxID=340320 RepID=UPI001049E2E2|nr:hypothetical protein [Leucobacter luti]MCW2287000.1 hypothetical protein [Leucobacter luti]TCK41226.1 hypothetical protein EDF60_1651 [Leucobacter luti]